MTKKIDRRIQRTRKALRDSVLELAAEVGFETLTIEQITKNANLGRTTFYLHYNDKYELLIDSLQTYIDSLFEEIYSPENVNKWIHEGIDPRRLFFIRAAEKPELYKMLFTDQVSGVVSNQFRLYVAQVLETITTAIQNQHNLKSRLPNVVIANYVSGALLGLLIWWLENDMPYPPEEIYQMYHTLLSEGAVKSIGF